MIGLYLDNFFDYGIADEVHELKGADTAQGSALGTLAWVCGRTVILTGTLLGGYAADFLNPVPPYAEEVIAVDMDPALRDAYVKLESNVSDALRQHHGNSSVISIGMNALLLYPDRPVVSARFTDMPRTRTVNGSASRFPSRRISRRTSSTPRSGG